MEAAFTHIYENNVWGNNKSAAYSGSSGGGSNVEYNNTTYVPFLKKFIQDRGIKTVVDLGCGDFKCGKLIYDDLDVTYTGYDTYEKMITYNSTQHTPTKYSFIHSDFYSNKESIVKADLCILKDVIQHWPLEHIYTFLDFLVTHKPFKYILLCNCSRQMQHNTTIEIGGGRPLSAMFYPLKRYNPEILYRYNTKEVSVIDTSLL